MIIAISIVAGIIIGVTALGLLIGYAMKIAVAQGLGW